MSTPQYLRKASLIVGDDQEAIDLSELRFRFVVRRGDISTPNTAEIRVYNVAPNTAQKLQKEFQRVVLQAGYGGNYGLIFDGSVIQIRRGRESQTDTYVDIRAASGDAAYNFAFANCTVAAGTTFEQQIDKMLTYAKPFNVSKGYVPDLPQTRLPRGKVVFDLIRESFDNLQSTLHGKWSIQDRHFNFIPLNSYIPGDPIEINAETGMVGMPEQTIGGLNVRTLLNPSVKIGHTIRINNASIQDYRLSLSPGDKSNNDAALNGVARKDADGLYYVMMADHYGDTRGNDWYSDLICLAVDATYYTEEFTRRGVIRELDTGPVKPYG
ncbi:hypothetical protein ACDA63_07140 [Uliginosibacterium sp. sgz301328]|uniref:phage protein n=1 Tax=Uliginosibacterium sp. sgz301328 TaxID=3243764 RepID=UPI00359D2DFF